MTFCFSFLLSKTLFGHSGSIEALSIDHPFGLLATGSADHTARIWDLSTNRCKAELRGHSGWVRSVAINGTNVFSGSNDHLIRMWDLTRIPPSSVTSSSSSSSKSRLLTPPILPGAPEFIAYAETTKKTGKSLWSFSSSTSSAHDADEGETVCSQKYIGHSGGVTCMWVDRGAMCSGSADKTVRQWDIETGKCVSVLRSKRWVDREENLDQVDSILYGGASPTTSSSQKLARDSSTGKLEGFLPGEDPGHWRSERDTSKRRNFVFDEFVVNGGGNNDDSNQQGFMLYNIGGQVNAIQFRQYALAAGYGDGIVRLWDMRTSESNRHLGGDAGHQSLNRRHSSSLDNTRHGDSITCLLFDDFNIVTGSVDKTVKVKEKKKERRWG